MDNEMKEILVTILFFVILIIIFISSISIPRLISQKMNIEKELKMKELEIYGEYRESEEIKK